MTFIHLVAPKRAVGSCMSAISSTTARPTGVFKVFLNALCPAKSYIQLTAVINTGWQWPGVVPSHVATQPPCGPPVCNSSYKSKKKICKQALFHAFVRNTREENKPTEVMLFAPY